MSWKVLLVVSVVSYAVFAFDSKKTTREILDKWSAKAAKEYPDCVQSSGATQEEVDNFFQLQTRAVSPNVKCYIYCLFKSFKFINQDGTFNKDELVKDIEKATDEMIQFCATNFANETDPCAFTYGIADCALHYEHVYV
ncbi:general odorant-binding protein 69a-like [Photinus pyralis]|nr:general odorant-binding protein 69a-like [Photinus pyralis]XP_031357373.1 general odorant-binding protein 69a-like [Photinus pyralis]